MSLGNFLRIEREERGGNRHYVVHLQDPKFSVELTPDAEAPDKMGRGVIKRVCVPNSWAGDYGKYAKLLGAAQEFFAEARKGEPLPKAVVRRLGRILGYRNRRDANVGGRNVRRASRARGPTRRG